MGNLGGKVIRWLGMVLVLCSAWIPDGAALAQEIAGDAAAREHFLRGQAAFEAADYEQALVHLQESYRLSQRGQLQYNIGRAEEALEAFEHYLGEVENPTREQEVRKRMAALQATIAKREQERALTEAAVRYAPPDSAPQPPRDRSSDRRIPSSAIVGSSVLAAVGVAGVAAMGVGIARGGSCVERDANGTCVTERAASAWTGVYGALGIAALAGSATWLAVSRKRTREKRSTAWMVTPAGIVVAGSF
jgi:tetratricopeptide (TPR) repeat protein